jgi:uncharacterized membrane protein
MALSNLGIFHTVIGVVAIVAAVVSLVQHGKIDLSKLTGKLYFYGTVITSVTALGLSKKGGFNPGHIFSLFILILVLIAFYLFSKKKGNIKARYFENTLLSFSLFLSMVPTINETFTRVPLGHPWAKGPGDPSIAITLLIFLILFIAGTIYQIVQQRKKENGFNG